jgi:2'-5' RNA ligase
VRPESIHLTLKFLGEIKEEEIEPIGARLRSVAAGTPPFHLSVKKLGVFPNEKFPRVLWIGIEQGREAVLTLQQKVEEGLVQLGFPPENRPFHPHLTLARIKSLRGTRELMDVVKSHENSEAGECPVDRVILFKSDLKPTGAVYTRMREATFEPDLGA